MSPPAWNTPSVLLITSPAHCDAAALRSSSADAILVQGTAADKLLAAVLATRGDLPVIVLQDVDEAGTLALIAQGADDVVPAGSRLSDIASAVRLALARRSRTPARRPSGSQGAVTFTDAPHLQAIARLSGGIAHEFNNLLTVVEGNVEQLRQGLGTRSELRIAADGIAAAAREAAVLTRQLLAFGRQQTLMPAPVDMTTLVADAAAPLRSVLGNGVHIVSDLARDLPAVRVDREQMLDVISNLAATAGEAMPEGGTFTIATDVHVVTEEDRRARPWLPAGRFVRLRVTDTGRGLEEQALPHVFEPFYPATVRGKGLVLSSVYGVVKQSGGYIWADSRLDKGTTVTILLPPLENGAGAARSDKVEKPARTPYRVLIVEDTDAVRQTLTSMLEWHGFAVTAASSAEEALEFARTLRFDLLLTDVALPGRSGPELARDFRDSAPGTPVIFMSGYSANSIDPRDLDDPRAFLQKPFPVQTLVERIHEMLAWARERGDTRSDARDGR